MHPNENHNNRNYIKTTLKINLIKSLYKEVINLSKLKMILLNGMVENKIDRFTFKSDPK